MICDVCHHPIDGCDRVYRSPTGRLSHFDCNATRTTMRTGLVQALYGDPPSDQPSPAAAPPTPVKSEAAKLIDSHMDLCQRARDIMVGKNHDYRGGSGDPFANFRGSVSLGIHPGVGILLRMQDKMMRVKTFIEKSQLMVKGEVLDDAILDIINYTVLLRGVLCGLPNDEQAKASEPKP